MAEVDASLYARAFPRNDPLEMAGKVTNLQQGILNNRLLGQQVQSKISAGRALGGAINPQTGLPDQALVGKYFTDNPQEAQYAADALAAAQTLHTGQLANQGTEAENQKKLVQLYKDRMGVAAMTYDSLLASEGPMTPDKIRSAAVGVIQSGLFNDQESLDQVLSVVRGLPPVTGNPQVDDKALRAYLIEQSIKANNGLEHANAVLGPLSNQGLSATDATAPTPVMVRNPDGTFTQSNVTRKQFRDMAAQGPVATEVPRTAGGLTAEKASELVDWKDPNTGKVYQVPRGALSDQAGLGGGGASGVRNGRYPGGGGGGAVLNDPDAPKGAVSMSQRAPGVDAAQQVSATKSAEIYQRDVDRAGGFATRMQTLDKTEAALAKALTGPGADKWQNFWAPLQTFGFKVPANVNDYATAEKYFQEYTNQRGINLGMNTDQSRALVGAATPSVRTPKGAADAFVKINKGIERLEAAQVAAARAAGISPAQYSEWRAEWNRDIDPAGFLPPRLTKAEWEAKAKSMGDKWPAYQKALKAGVAAKVISLSDYMK